MGCSEVFESSQDERDLEVAGVVSGEEWKGVGGNQSTGRNKLSTAGSPLRLQHNNGTECRLRSRQGDWRDFTKYNSNIISFGNKRQANARASAW